MCVFSIVSLVYSVLMVFIYIDLYSSYIYKYHCDLACILAVWEVTLYFSCMGGHPVFYKFRRLPCIFQV